MSIKSKNTSLDGKHKCPVCGGEVDFFDICDTCKWQYDGERDDPDKISGPNAMSLNEARSAWEQRRKS